MNFPQGSLQTSCSSVKMTRGAEREKEEMKEEKVEEGKRVGREEGIGIKWGEQKEGKVGEQ